MTPIVNVDVKMSKSMLNALTVHEAYCTGMKIHEVTENDVVTFLSDRFSNALANKFENSYLY